jgi:hypothetical protein
LTESGLCGIQVNHGYANKPETCRLFPFNRILRIDDYLVVAPHPTLCPLQVLEGGKQSELSSHMTLRSSLSAQGVTTEFRQGRCATSDVARLIQLENAIVHLSEEYLEKADYTGFAIAQAELTHSMLGTSGQPPSNVDMRAFSSMLSRVVGIVPEADEAVNRSLVRVLVASTPALRAHLLFRGTTDAPPVIPQDIPNILLALRYVVRLAHDAGMRTITYQTVLSLFDGYQPLLRMLALIDRSVVWLPERTMTLWFHQDAGFQRQFINILQGLLPASQGQTGRLLGDLLCDRIQGETVHRLLFLKRLAARLAGQIVPFTDARAKNRPSLRQTVQMLLLKRLSDELLVKVAERQSRNIARMPASTVLVGQE